MFYFYNKGVYGLSIPFMPKRVLEERSVQFQQGKGIKLRKSESPVQGRA